MKITKILAYQVDLPYKGGVAAFSSGRQFSMLDSTVVEIQTDAGITGYGEVGLFNQKCITYIKTLEWLIHN